MGASQSVRGGRVLLAFLVVPGLAALLMATFQPAYDGLESYLERVWRTAVIYGLFGAYPTALIFGVPAFIILRDRIDGTWLNCALVGAGVAAAPWLAIILLAPNADQASIGGRATVVDGARTVFGWLNDLQSVGFIAIFGVFAGLFFWLIATGGHNLTNEPSSDDLGLTE